MDALMDEAAAATRRDDAKKRTKDPKPTGLTPNAKHGRPVGLATYAPTSALEQNAGSGAAASLAPDDEAARPTTPVESDDETTLSVQARWVGAPSQTNRLVEALDNVRALQAHLSTPDVLVLSCAARGFDAFATPPFWRELFERDWPGVGPALVSGAKPRDVARSLAARGVWRSAEASLVTGPRPPGKPEPPAKGFYEHRPPFTENVPRVFGHDTSAADRKRLDGWRIRATLNRRRLGRFNGTRRGWNRRGHHKFDETLYDCVGLTGRPRFGGGCSNWETQVLFPFTTGFGRGPAWKDDEYVRAFDDEDWEELNYDSYLSEDGPELGEALRANSNSDDWYSSTPKRTTTSELRLDVDLVRRSDGALVRLASGTSAWQDMADVGYEAVWEEMVLTNDPFCRLHAHAVLNFEGDERNGLHLRFFDSSINQNGWDGGAIIPEGLNQPILCAILARTLALHDMASACDRLVSYRCYETPETAAWRATTATILLAARRGDGLRSLSPELVREVAAFAVGPRPRPEEGDAAFPKAPDRSVLTEVDKIHEYVAPGEDVDTRDWPAAQSAPPADYASTDASRYLFVAQVRGFRPACARLHAVREDTTLRRATRNEKHHVVFQLERRHIEHETSSTFASYHASRYLAVHVVRVADGAVVEMPLTHYNLADGQWPRGGSSTYGDTARLLLGTDSAGGERAGLSTTVHPLCHADVSFAKRGSRAHAGYELDFMTMLAFGAENVKKLTAETEGPPLARDELRINFKSRHDADDYRYHVRLGPSPREEFKAASGGNPVLRGGGLLAYVDELFQIKAGWK